MSLSDELYRETILDHYHHPRNQGTLEHPTVEVEGVNPLCGDELTLYLTIEDGKISEVRLKSRGCSINTASGSMMTEVISGQTLERAEELVDKFKYMMLNKDLSVALPEEMEDLEALQGVKRYPVRIKCALLPWNTLLESISSLRQQSDGSGETIKGKMVTTED